MGLLRSAGFRISGTLAMNDVVNHYGMGDMAGNRIVAAYGTAWQTVWVDAQHNVRWPGEDLTGLVPKWRLSGVDYVRFLRRRHPELVLAECGTLDVVSLAASWRRLGQTFATLVGDPKVRDFLGDAALRAAMRYRAFAAAVEDDSPPILQLSGGAVTDDRVWAIVSSVLDGEATPHVRVLGEPGGPRASHGSTPAATCTGGLDW